ncbi:MAG: NUDIX hydrolase [Planctomycetes bacterium]|nr:NUDIX hydrolase [Planctomycetota bacterium]
MTRPFERISSKVLVDNPWHRYCHDRYARRDGSPGDYYYVDMAGSSVVVPLLDNGDVVILEVERYLLGTKLWEFPIGGLEPGDDPLHVAQKELAEESGYRANRWDALGVFAPYKGVSNEHCHVFLARELEPGAQALELSESIDVHVVSLDEARRRMLGQAVGDGQSIAAFAYLDRFLAR